MRRYSDFASLWQRISSAVLIRTEMTATAASIKTDRLYCVNNDGERDYIVCDEVEKKGLFKKVPTPVTLYFNDLMEKNKRGELPKSK